MMTLTTMMIMLARLKVSTSSSVKRRRGEEREAAMTKATREKMIAFKGGT